MKFPSFVYLLLMFLNITVFIRSLSQPTCLTGDRAQKFNERMVKDHNKYRSHHGVPLLVADDALINSSIAWSHELALKNLWEHDNQSKYGENLYRDSNTDSIDELNLNPVQPWYCEIKDYPNHDGSKMTGHYTQVVWKSSSQVGCGVCLSSSGTYVTCRYYPPGNVRGTYEENVIEPKSIPCECEPDEGACSGNTTDTTVAPTDTTDTTVAPTDTTYTSDTKCTIPTLTTTPTQTHIPTTPPTPTQTPTPTVTSTSTPTTSPTPTKTPTPGPDPMEQYLLLFTMITLGILGLTMVIILSIIVYYYAMNFDQL